MRLNNILIAFVAVLAGLSSCMKENMPLQDGQVEVDWNAIREGYQLAFPGKRSYARTKPVTQESNTNLTPDELEDLLMWDEYRYWSPECA